MLFLGLLGLVIFGPKKLAAVGQQAGKTLACLKKISSDFQSQLQTEISATRSDQSVSSSSNTGTGMNAN
jgi:Sec-independent protein translocase protein TatA